MSFRFLMGAKIAERAPTTMLALPWYIFCHCWCRCEDVSAECRTATFENLAWNLEAVCGVSEISGTRIMMPGVGSSGFSFLCISIVFLMMRR